MDNLKDFIYIEENTLSKDFCDHCIQKFENDDRKSIGVFGSGKIDETIKQSMDLRISLESDWNEENITFDKSLSEHYESYVNKTFPEEYRNDFHARSKGFQIQRTEPGQFYRYHSDSYRDRLVTFIWYLNDVIEDAMEPKKVSQVGLHLMKFCAKHDMQRIADNVQLYAEALNAKYA